MFPWLRVSGTVQRDARIGVYVDIGAEKADIQLAGGEVSFMYASSRLMLAVSSLAL